MTPVEIISTSEDFLEQTVYDFTFIQGVIYLDRMLILERQTKRHKFVMDLRRSYSRINSRDFGVKQEPDIDLDIQLKAVNLYRCQITFKKWSYE